MPFNTIQDVSRSQSLLGKIFSVGTITLYSAYDGKELELKDVSSPKKIEDIIFENIRGTHLRYRNIYDDAPDFNPIRPNSNEPTHYRRMEDLDDLELVDAKRRKQELRDIRRKARNSRNNYGNSYDAGYSNQNDYDDPYYDDVIYPEDRDYYRNRPRDDRRAYNNSYNRGGYPDSHHHQYSGAIKESYERNPDKYFANNYEEFHQNNLDAQRDYIERDYNQGSYVPRDDAYDDSFEKKENKSKGLSRFNPFSSNKKEDENISDEEFDSTINQAMHDMDSNIRFEPSSNHPHYSNDRRYDRGYDNRAFNDDSYTRNRGSQSYNQSRNYRSEERPGDLRDDYNSRDSYRSPQYDSRDNYRGSQYDSRDSYRSPQYDSRDSYRSPQYDSRDSYHASKQQYNSQYDDYSDNYNQSRDYNRSKKSNYNKSNRSGYNQSNRANYNQSRGNNNRYNESQYYADRSYSEESSSAHKEESREKTPDDLFEKHSRKFRR